MNPKQPSDSQLDKLLVLWSEPQHMNAQQKVKLLQGIQRDLRSADLPAVSFEADSGRWNRVNISTGGVMAAAITVLLLAFTFGQGWHKRATKEKLVQNSTVTVGEFHHPPLEADMKNDRQLLAEFQDVFDHQVAWISTEATELRIGLLPGIQRGKMLTSDSPYIAIRLTLVARPENSEEKNWKIVRQNEVLTQSEQFVELTSNQKNIAGVTLWAYRVEGEHSPLIAIDLTYDVVSPQITRFVTSELQPADAVARVVHQFESDGIQYRLLQAATLLELGAPG